MIRRAAAQQTRLQLFDTAVDLFFSGRAAACLDALRGHGYLASKLLGARAYLRLDDPEHALRILDGIEATDLFDARRAELSILRAAALTAMRNFVKSRYALDVARALVLGQASPALEAEYFAQEAIWSFSSGDSHSSAEAAARTIEAGSVDVASEAAFSRAPDYLIPREHTVARAQHVLAILAARDEDYARQVEYERQAVATFGQAPKLDLWAYARLLFNFAVCIRDFDLAADAQTLRAVDMASWPSELNSERFHIYSALGVSSALRGDHLGAFRELRKSAESAPSAEYVILASTDKAMLRRELGELMSAREELEHAADLADRVDWERSGEQRVALAHLAREVAAFDAQRARALLERYYGIRTALSPHLLNNSDRRLRAHEKYAEGTVLRALGMTDEAKPCFAEAFDIWQPLGLDWLAALAAAELYELGGPAKFKTYATRQAKLRPGSWIERRAAQLKRR